MTKHHDEMMSVIVDICTLPRRDVEAEVSDALRLYDYPPRGDYSDDRPIFTVDGHPGTKAEQQESGDRCREASIRYGTKPETR